MTTCTVIPTYPPHFHFAVDALRTHSRFVNSNLYFIFTNDEHYGLFNEQLPADLKDVKWDYIISNTPITDNVITLKKFHAVDVLSNTYDYIGVFDSEILFVKYMDTNKIYKEISDSKIFKSNKRHGSEHLKHVAHLMGLSDNEILKSKTENFTQYWWFNDICVYDTKLFKEFYVWFRTLPNHHVIMNDFSCFDYLLYSLWLLSFKDYNLKKHLTEYTLAGAAIETNFSSNDVSYEFMSYQDRNINHEEIDHIKVQIMIDRDINHCQNEGKKLYVL